MTWLVSRFREHFSGPVYMMHPAPASGRSVRPRRPPGRRTTTRSTSGPAWTGTPPSRPIPTRRPAVHHLDRFRPLPRPGGLFAGARRQRGSLVGVAGSGPKARTIGAAVGGEHRWAVARGPRPGGPAPGPRSRLRGARLAGRSDADLRQGRHLCGPEGGHQSHPLGVPQSTTAALAFARAAAAGPTIRRRSTARTRAGAGAAGSGRSRPSA